MRRCDGIPFIVMVIRGQWCGWRRIVGTMISDATDGAVNRTDSGMGTAAEAHHLALDSIFLCCKLQGNEVSSVELLERRCVEWMKWN